MNSAETTQPKQCPLPRRTVRVIPHRQRLAAPHVAAVGGAAAALHDHLIPPRHLLELLLHGLLLAELNLLAGFLGLVGLRPAPAQRQVGYAQAGRALCNAKKVGLSSCASHLPSCCCRFGSLCCKRNGTKKLLYQNCIHVKRTSLKKEMGKRTKAAAPATKSP